MTTNEKTPVASTAGAEAAISSAKTIPSVRPAEQSIKPRRDSFTIDACETQAGEDDCQRLHDQRGESVIPFGMLMALGNALDEPGSGLDDRLMKFAIGWADEVRRMVRRHHSSVREAAHRLRIPPAAVLRRAREIDPSVRALEDVTADLAAAVLREGEGR